MPSNRGRARHQKGFIVCTPAGGWEAHWFPYVVDPVTGKERRVHRSKVIGYKPKMRKFEAEDELQKIVARVNPVTSNANIPQDDSVTFRWFAENRWKPLYEGNWRDDSTARQNDWLLEVVNRRFGETEIRELDAVQVQAWLNDLAKTGGRAGKGASRSMIRQLRTTLRSIGEQLEDQDFVRKNPLKRLSMPLTRRPDKSTAEWSTLQAYVKALDEMQHRLVVKIGGACGVRPEELFAFRWRCLHTVADGRSVLEVQETVYRNKIRPYGKTDASERFVALPARLAEELRAWRKQSRHAADDDFIFTNSGGGFIDPNNFRNRVLLPLSRDPHNLPRLTFQMLRRTMATRAYKEKMGDLKDIQKQMGHAKPDITIEEYVQDLDGSVFAMADSLYAEIEKAPAPQVAAEQLRKMRPATRRTQ